MALTLKPNIIANYRKLGKKPRIFIRIPSANIFIGTSPSQISTNNFTDSIAEFDTITKSIAKYGGMAEVSGFGVRNLQLGSRFTLCTEASIGPQLGAYAGAGRLYAEGVADYSSARNSETASDIGSPAIVIGRRNIAGIPIYQVIRSYMQFAIPSGMTSCEEATIEMTGVNKQTYQAFTIRVALGTWSALGSSIFNDFTAWASSGAYLITDLNESWSTSEYSYGTTNKIRLNTAGKAQVLANTGSTLKLMLLSSLDVSNAAAPSYDEYCQFNITGVVLKLRYNTITLDNKDAEVYLAYDDGAMPTSYSNMQLIWKGVVDDYSLNKTSLNLKLKQNDHKKNIQIPKKIINKTDWPNCPDENIGKVYPILYGQFDIGPLHKKGVGNYIADNTSGSADYVGYPDCFKGITVNVDNTYRTVLFSGHDRGLRLFDNNYLFTWNSSINAYELLPVLALTTYDTDLGYYKELSPFSISANVAEVLTEGKYKAVATVIPDSHVNVGCTNPEYAYDEIASNYAVIPNSTSYIEFIFSNLQGINSGGANAFLLKAAFIGGADPTKTKIKLYKNERDEPDDVDNWVATGSDVALWTADGVKAFYFLDVDSNYNKMPIQLELYKIRIYRTDNTGEARISNFCALSARDNNEFNELYTYGLGKVDTTPASITGTSGGLIENPSHVIESFARDDMSLVTSEINTTAFDTAATALTSWKYAFQINDRKGARNFLHNFYRQCRSKGLWDEQDRLSIKTFSASNYFSVSGTDVPTGLDIFDTTGSPYLEQVTTNPIMDLEITQIGIDEVINDFVLKYRKNYATGEYLETLYMTNGLGVVGDVETNLSDSNLEESQTVAALSALCASSYSKYETTNTLEFEADLIRDETTASMLLQYLIERMWKRRYMVTVTTLDTGARIEEGDFINIRDTRINDLFGETTAYLKKWEIIRKTIDLNNMRYTFETIEVD